MNSRVGRVEKSPIKSAARTLRIFEVFDEMRRPLSVSEIAESVGLPQSSATELVKSLISLGYLTKQDNARTYLPTLRIAVLGSWLEASMVNQGGILQLMNELHGAVGETIILGVEHGTKVHYTHLVTSEHELRIQPTDGTMRNICRANLGLMLLTLKNNEEIRRLVLRINAESPNTDQLDWPNVLANVETARGQGYSALASQVTEGAGVYAVLLPRIEGQQVMALGIGAPLHRFGANLDFFKEAMESVVARYF